MQKPALLGRVIQRTSGVLMALQYIVYCDESSKKGAFFSGFYGGLAVSSTHYEEAVSRLTMVKTDQNLHGEVKWSKVTEQYLAKYVAFTDEVFDLLAEGKIRIRIMFTQNRWRPARIKPEHRGKEYFLLYYQFLKHAFGWQFSNPTGRPVSLRFLLDQLAETGPHKEDFKRFLLRLQHQQEFRQATLTIRREDIGEATSHDHVLLQALDVVLGAVFFRLNDLHKEKPPGSRRRGRRTVAKAKLYRHINQRIRLLYPGFNVGATTGIRGNLANRWNHPYRHWLFMPRDAVIDQDARTK